MKTLNIIQRLSRIGRILSMALGVMFIVMPQWCRYGVELREGKE